MEGKTLSTGPCVPSWGFLAPVLGPSAGLVPNKPWRESGRDLCGVGAVGVSWGQGWQQWQLESH